MSSATSIVWGINILAQASAHNAWPSSSTQAIIDRLMALPDADDEPLPIGWWTKAAAIVASSGLPNAASVAQVLASGEAVLAVADRSWLSQGEEFFEALTQSTVQAIAAPVQATAGMVGAATQPIASAAESARQAINKTNSTVQMIGLPLVLLGGLWFAKKVL